MMLTGGKGVFGGKRGVCTLAFMVCMLIFTSVGFCQVGPEDVLILVNENSPTSKYIAKLYRQYYPAITESQVLYLSGLTDCSGPASTSADEIIATRKDYDLLIADPVRAYLLANNMVNSVRVIITTAGMPYRIEDTYVYFANLVSPGGSAGYPYGYIGYVNAASVESELTVLFQTDSLFETPLALYDRVVNPYQGYRNSDIHLFDRDIVFNLPNMNWRYPTTLIFGHEPPMMEGDHLTLQGVRDRNFSVGDMYLTCRLDGPKDQGQSAVFAVRQMLERSRKASSTQYGINPAEAVVVLDDAPGASDLNNNRIYNLNISVDYIIFQSGVSQPPNTGYAETRDDFNSGFHQMTDSYVADSIFNTATMPNGNDLTVVCDKRPAHRTNQDDLGAGQSAVAVCTFGVNGDESSPESYIKTGGPAGGPLFDLTYGSVFCSLESFNAVTMFSDVSVGQGKIVDFLEIGGCGAIGHSFEPYEESTMDTEFIFYNLLADSDKDGRADVSFVEAAFTGIPHISWSEVVIGDPLMRIAYGPGGYAQPIAEGDLNCDGQVANLADFAVFAKTFLSTFDDDDGSGNYNDLCDFDRNGVVDLEDFVTFVGLYQ